MNGPETIASIALLPLTKGPRRDRPVRASQAQAGVFTQIVNALWPLPSTQIIGTANDNEWERRRQPHGDHICGDELAQPDAGVKSDSAAMSTSSALAAISTSTSG